MDNVAASTGEQRLKLSHWSTDMVVPARRFSVWAMRPWPSIASVFDIAALGPFATRVDSVLLGEAALQFAHGTARRYTRSGARCRADGIDAVGITLLIDGTIVGEAAGRPIDAGPGAIVFLDLAQRTQFVLSEATSIQLAVPRTLANHHLGTVADLHGIRIDAERAAFLDAHLNRLRSEIPHLTVKQGPLLAGIILDLLAVALGRGQASVPVRPGASAIRLAAEQAIDDALDGGGLDAATICTRLNITRSTLYRLFQREGGFQAYARRHRLEHVRQSLADPSNTETIAALAQRWGFADGPHLSRLFQAQFGYTPTKYRIGIRA